MQQQVQTLKNNFMSNNNETRSLQESQKILSRRQDKENFADFTNISNAVDYFSKKSKESFQVCKNESKNEEIKMSSKDEQKQLSREIYDLLMGITKKVDNDLMSLIKRQLQFQPNKENINQNEPSKNLMNLKTIITVIIKAYYEINHEIEDIKNKECSEYENMVQKLEAEVRQHIRIEQQLKLYAESTQAKLDEMEKLTRDGDQGLKNQIELLMNENSQLKQNLQQQNKELNYLKKDNIQKGEQLKNFEDKLNVNVTPQLTIPQHPFSGSSSTTSFKRQDNIKQQIFNESMKNSFRKDSICSSQPIFTERNEFKSDKQFIKKQDEHKNVPSENYSNENTSKHFKKEFHIDSEKDLNLQLDEKDAEIIQLEKKLRQIQKIKEQQEKIETSQRPYLSSSFTDSSLNHAKSVKSNSTRRDKSQDEKKEPVKQSAKEYIQDKSYSQFRNESKQKDNKISLHQSIGTNQSKISLQEKLRSQEDKVANLLKTNSNLSQTFRSKSVDGTNKNYRTLKQKSNNNDSINEKIKNYKNAYNTIIDKTTELLKAQNKYGLQKSFGKY